MLLLMRADNRPLHTLLAAPRALLALSNMGTTLARFLDGCTADPRLRTVLCGPHMDYGVAPSRVSVMLHAGLMAHYLVSGAYYPKGGGQVIADRLSEAIEARGGKVMLRAKVSRIHVENGRAVGVTFTNKHVGERTVKAPVVISNADIKKTFTELLPEGAVRKKTLDRVRGFEMAPGIAVVYLGVRAEVLGKETKNTNHWIFAGDDVERDYADIAAGRFCDEPLTYMTLTSLKDPTVEIAPAGVVNLQIMTAAPASFAAWGTTAPAFADGSYRHAPGYLESKAALRDRLVRRAESILPGLGDAIVYSEVATPLTHARYTWASGGTPYGIAATPAQFLFNRPEARTEIKGFFLAGASARQAHGIVGSLMSGRDAAVAALRSLGGTAAKERTIAAPPVLAS
jgi:phytoene dehydrogenase-like protein